MAPTDPSDDAPSPGRPTPSGFDALVRRAQDGDRAAMDGVLAVLRPDLERLARPYADPTRPAQSTMDLLQEACLRAWTRIGTFAGSDNDEETFAMFRSWIGQIVRRLGMDRAKEVQRQRRHPGEPIARIGEPGAGHSTGMGARNEPEDPGGSPSTIVRSAELRGRFEAALRDLPDATNAEIVRLYILEGMKIAAIAERLGMPHETVRGRYWKTVQRLQRELEGLF